VCGVLPNRKAISDAHHTRFLNGIYVLRRVVGWVLSQTKCFAVLFAHPETLKVSPESKQIGINLWTLP
jgi:hypothetical protein